MQRHAAPIGFVVCTIVLCGGSVVALGKSSSSPESAGTQPAGATTGPATRPTTSPAAKNLSADEMLGQLLRPPPAAEQVSPDGDPAIAPVWGGGFQEGTFLRDRTGRLTKTREGKTAFLFDGRSDKDAPVLILPNLQLMMMESAQAATTRDLRFRVSGMITGYRGQNYVLLEDVSRGGEALHPAAEARDVDRKSGAGAVKPGAPEAQVMREGGIISDRVARLTRSPDGAQAELMFDADGKALRDPPMIILPNSKLEAMEGAVVSADRDLKFRVTGLVTEYKGRNYILLDKVVVVPDVVEQFNR